MSFDVLFAIVATIVGIGFVTVVGLVISSAVRSATDPEYRARIAARPRRSHQFMDTPPYNPVNDPGNPASPMFPGNPGNPL